MTEQEGVYNCKDADLQSMLQRLFDEGNDEIVVTNPGDGEVVVTKADFKRHLFNIEKANKMSPADRIVEKGKLKARKNQQQIKFRTALIDADVCKVDIEAGTFGEDIEGNKLDIEGMIFIAVKDYPKKTELKDGEIGCFYSEDGKQEPIRIV